MAEQEACTELVKQASQDQSAGQSIDGESLLLPLLQGLLDAPETEQPHDSGTESGEDQRSGLIAEVQKALDKLATSLRNDATDITPERRSSILSLVSKLQAGLTLAAHDRRENSSHHQARFNRRRERYNRHTIGVSSEELADARRLIEEISGPSTSTCTETNVPLNQTKTHPVKNSTPKPFSCSNSVSSSASSSIQTPSESTDCIGYLFNENKESDSVNQSPIPYDNVIDQHVNAKFNNVADSEDDSSTVKLDRYPKPDLIMQSNPIYTETEKLNRFNTKKLKMRRANTIDIPKPLHFYECDDESDVEDEDRRRRNNYLALRGPIRVGNGNVTNRNSMPVLEPKTENDKKFLAFINKHNDRNQRHSLWASKAEKSTWNNKFDHLKTNFEKNTDVSVGYGSNKYDPKISKNSARNLMKMFEEKQRNDKATFTLSDNRVPQPLPVNKFSHAPSSAFQPVNRNPVKTQNVENTDANRGGKSLFLYAPKPLKNESVTSPPYVKPWLGNSNESRVLSIAARKFENAAPPPTQNFQPNKLNREKITAPVFHDTSEKLTAPYLVKSLDQKSNTVRKLSGQYDNLGKIPDKTQIEGFQPRFTVPQNYSIRYDKPRTVFQPQKNVVNRFPFVENQTSDVKKYVNHAHNNVRIQFQPEVVPVVPAYRAQTQVHTVYNDVHNNPARPNYETQTSLESLKEYQAINSRVMCAPVPQTASTVRQKSPMTRNEHDLDAAYALKNVLQKVSNSPSPNTPQYEDTGKMNDTGKIRNIPYSSCQITDRGEHIVTGKLPIPAINVRSSPVVDSTLNKPTHSQILSKSDSWHQICLINQTTSPHKPSPRSSPNARNIVKSKSTHSMLPAKQFEAGMTKEEILEKKRTLEGFFGQSPSPTGGKVVKRAINRTKTSEKNAQYRQTQAPSVPVGLMRSRTLPDIVCPDLLDETNVDKAFDELFSSS